MDYKFSVSMCVYGKDRPEWFKAAVDSILHQSVKPTEVILIVDGPVSDLLNNVILEYEQLENVKIFRLDKNQGHGNARRIGFENCKYELVALMDADDISVYERFEKQLEKFKDNPSLDIVGGNIEEFIDDPGQIVSKRIVPMEDIEIKEYMKKRCPMNQVTVMVKKNAVLRAGGYLDWYCNEDYYLWIRMFLKGMIFENINETLVKVRVGDAAYRRRGGWMYFKSECKLQNYMLKNKVIDRFLYIENVAKRLIIQILLPNKLRGWLFQKFARESVE